MAVSPSVCLSQTGGTSEAGEGGGGENEVHRDGLLKCSLRALAVQELVAAGAREFAALRISWYGYQVHSERSQMLVYWVFQSLKLKP